MPSNGLGQTGLLARLYRKPRAGQRKWLCALCERVHYGVLSQPLIGKAVPRPTSARRWYSATESTFDPYQVCCPLPSLSDRPPHCNMRPYRDRGASHAESTITAPERKSMSEDKKLPACCRLPLTVFDFPSGASGGTSEKPSRSIRRRQRPCNTAKKIALPTTC
jgi:hypothetical protein